MRVGIVITTRNGIDFTKSCVNSVVCSFPYDLIIVDDGSTDGTPEWAESVGARVFKDLDEPSLGGRWNVGIKEAFALGADVALVCNNDIIFSPLTIDAVTRRMDEVLRNDERIAVVTAHNLRGRMSTRKIRGLDELTWEPSESDGPDFSCFLISKKAYEEVGPVSEEYVPCYFEDNDYHIKMALAGYRAISTTGAPYYHYGSVTQNSIVGGVCTGPQFEHNRDLFETKYGFNTTSEEYKDIINAAKEGTT